MKERKPCRDPVECCFCGELVDRPAYVVVPALWTEERIAHLPCVMWFAEGYQDEVSCETTLVTGSIVATLQQPAGLFDSLVMRSRSRGNR